MALKRKFSRKILYRQHEELFFKSVKEGQTYKYHWIDYIFDDVEKAAKKYGIEIEYNSSLTNEYYKYGCYSFKIISTPFEKVEKPKEVSFFDINELAI